MTFDGGWQLYVLQCSDGTLYTGITNNVSRRLAAHNSGRGAKYTRSRKPCLMIAKSSLFSQKICARAERMFKKLTRSKKEYFLLDGIDTFIFRSVLPSFPEHLNCNKNDRD